MIVVSDILDNQNLLGAIGKFCLPCQKDMGMSA